MKSALMICAMLFAFSACGNRETHTLVYNVNAGDTFRYQITVDMSMKQDFMGQTMNIGTTMEMLAVYHINSVEENSIDMDFLFESMRMDMFSDFFEMSVSSDTDAEFVTAEDISPMFRAMTNLPFNMVIDRQGNVQSMSGFEQMFDAMLSVIDEEVDEFTKQQVLAQLNQQFSPETMQDNMGQQLVVFPEHPVRIGESWNTSTTVSFGEMSMTMDAQTTLRRVNGNIAVLEIRGNFSTDAPIVQITEGMVARTSLTGTQTGTMEIDMNTGWTVSGNIVQDMEMETEMQGMTIPQSISTVTTILAK